VNPNNSSAPSFSNNNNNNSKDFYVKYGCVTMSLGVLAFIGICSYKNYIQRKKSFANYWNKA